MAKYRFVHCKFWEDVDILDYTPEEKYFYLYLLTNPHTQQCGIYEISIKQMAFETGYNRDTVKELLQRFEDNKDKIKYDNETKEIAIKNWPKYNLQNTGKPILDCIEKELEGVKSKGLVKYLLKQVEQNKVKSLYDNKLHEPVPGRGTSGTQKEKEKEKEVRKTKKTSEVSDKTITQKPKFPVNSQPYKMAIKLKKLIKENSPRQPVPDDDPISMEKWSLAMDRLNRLGPKGGKGGDQSYSWQEIEKLIEWCQQDEFWWKNILSAPTFREKIVKLENQMKQEKGDADNDKGNSLPESTIDYEEVDEFVQRIGGS